MLAVLRQNASKRVTPLATHRPTLEGTPPQARRLHQSSHVVQESTQKEFYACLTHSLTETRYTEKQASQQKVMQVFNQVTTQTTAQQDCLAHATALAQQNELNHQHAQTIISHMQARLYLAIASYTQKPGHSLYHASSEKTRVMQRSPVFPHHFTLLEHALYATQRSLGGPSDTLKNAFNRTLDASPYMRHYARVINVLYTTHNPAFIVFMHHMAMGGHPLYTELAGWQPFLETFTPRMSATHQEEIAPYFDVCFKHTASLASHEEAAYKHMLSHVSDQATAEDAIYVMQQFNIAQNKLFSQLEVNCVMKSQTNHASPVVELLD